jgi:hypothetical protein
VNYLRAAASKYAQENPNARAVHVSDLAAAAMVPLVNVHEILRGAYIPIKRNLVWFRDLGPLATPGAPVEEPHERRNISPPVATRTPWNSRSVATRRDIPEIRKAARSYRTKFPEAELVPVVDLALRTGLEVNSIAPILRSAGIGSVIVNKDRHIRLDQLLPERSADPEPNR